MQRVSSDEALVHRWRVRAHLERQLDAVSSSTRFDPANSSLAPANRPRKFARVDDPMDVLPDGAEALADEALAPESDVEDVAAAGLVVQVPRALLEAPPAAVRTALLHAWKHVLSDADRTALAPLLPNGDHEAATVLLGGERLFFGNPVDAFLLRTELGLYHPRVVGLRADLVHLGSEIARTQLAAHRSAALQLSGALETLNAADAGPHVVRSRGWLEAQLEDLWDHNDSQLTTMILQRPFKPFGALATHTALPRAAVQAGPAGPRALHRVSVSSLMPVSSPGAAAPSAAAAADLTRAQRKMQSRIIDGLFMDSYNWCARWCRICVCSHHHLRPCSALHL